LFAASDNVSKFSHGCVLNQVVMTIVV